MMELVDIAAVSELAHAVGATVVVDNVFRDAGLLLSTAARRRCRGLLDDQAHRRSGAECSAEPSWGPRTTSRARSRTSCATGPSMSAFNAWVMLKGLETLDLRVQRMHENALTLARHLEAGQEWSRVLHPWLASHPQHDLARRQMSGGGTVITIDLAGAGRRPSPSSTRCNWSTSPATSATAGPSPLIRPTTTHRRLTPRARALPSASPMARCTVSLGHQRRSPTSTAPWQPPRSVRAMADRPTVLVVHHTVSPALDDLLDAALAGVRDPALDGLVVQPRAALSATASDVPDRRRDPPRHAGEPGVDVEPSSTSSTRSTTLLARDRRSAFTPPSSTARATTRRGAFRSEDRHRPAVVPPSRPALG